MTALEGLRREGDPGLAELPQLDWRPIAGPRWWEPRMLAGAAFGALCLAVMAICALVLA